MLCASIDERPQSWPECLPALFAAYRMTPHSVTGADQLRHGHARARDVAARLSYRPTPGGARRSYNIFCGGLSQKPARCAIDRSQRD